MERGARGRACVPHHGAEALAGDGVPALVVRDCVALVGGAAMCAAAAHRRRLLPSPCQSSRVLVYGAGGDGEAWIWTPSPDGPDALVGHSPSGPDTSLGGLARH